MALDSEAIHEIGETGLEQLASNNLRIFGKCLNAMKANNIPDNVLQDALQRINVFGQRPGEENKTNRKKK